MKEEHTYRHCFWVLVACIALALVTLGIFGQKLPFGQVAFNAGEHSMAAGEVEDQ